MSAPGERPGRETAVVDKPVRVTAAEDRVPVARKMAHGLGTTNDMWGNWLYPRLVWPVFKLSRHVSPHLNRLALGQGRRPGIRCELETRWG